MKNIILTVAAAALVAASLSADQKIAQRKENQQDRIAQGVKSGQLTAGETVRLETKESKLNKETRTERAANGGKLTGAEKRQVNRQQNRLSTDIYKDKHNSAVQ